MSFADVHLNSSPHHHDLTSSSPYSHAQHHHPQPFYGSSPDAEPPVQWGEWTNHDMVSDTDSHHGSLAHQRSLSDLVPEENHFRQFTSEDLYHGVGLGMDMEQDPRDYTVDTHDLGANEDDYDPDATLEMPPRARTRLQRRFSKSQVDVEPQSFGYTPSDTSPSTPARSRSSSLHQSHTPLHLSISNPPSSPSLFSGGLPSPFRQPGTPTSASMDPALSVRSSSPSSTSSHGGVQMSRVGSSSASSSNYGGDAVASLAMTRSTMSSSQLGRSPSLQSHSRRSSSPKKATGRGNSRKLSNLDRKNICLHREAYPGIKQDIIAELFSVERSTVSKILKNKDHWLNVAEDDDSPFTPSKSAPLTRSPSKTNNALARSPSKSTPLSRSPSKQSHTSTPSSSATSIVSLPPATPGTPKITGGRYPDLDNDLASWARTLVAFGTALEDSALQAKALELAPKVRGCESFKASQTWLEGFKLRAGITAGTFLDMLSPDSKDRVKREIAAAAAEAEDEVDGALASDDELSPKVEENDDDFGETTGTRRSRRTKRRPASISAIGQQQQQQLRSPAVDIGMARATSPSVMRMEIDARTPLRQAAHDESNESEATPTHSTTHSRSSSKPDSSRLAQSFRYPSRVAEAELARSLPPTATPPRFTHGHPTPLSVSTAHYTPSPSDSNSAFSPFDQYLFKQHGSNGATHSHSHSHSFQDMLPLQSPFQGGSHSPSTYSAMGVNPAHTTGSGGNSPAGIGSHHGRSGSTASVSTTSSYSGLTAFSSQNGTPLTGSLYGSFSHSQANSSSTPSTPATGYFGHGPDGTQSQLQAAFLVQQSGGAPSAPGQQQQNSTPLGRRATISGGAPFNPLNRAGSTGSTPPSPALSLEVALASMQKALEYLGREGQGFVSPGDLVVLADVKGKMTAALRQQQQQQKRGSPTGLSQPMRPSTPTERISQAMAAYHMSSGSQSSAPSKQRIKLGRTQSAGNIVSLGMGRRSQSSTSMFSSSGSVTPSVLMEEGH